MRRCTPTPIVSAKSAGFSDHHGQRVFGSTRLFRVSFKKCANLFTGLHLCPQSLLMKVDRLTRTFSWLLITLGPAFTIALNFVLFGRNYHSSLRIFLLATVCTLLITLLLSRIHIGLSNWLRKKIAARPSAGQRLMAQILFLAITAAFVTIIFFGYHWVDFPGYTLKMENYKWALLVGFTDDHHVAHASGSSPGPRPPPRRPAYRGRPVRRNRRSGPGRRPTLLIRSGWRRP